HVLFYGTGGFAYGDVRQHANYDGDPLGGSGTQVGWVAGGGIEYKINPAWSVKGEYQYIDLGSASTGSETAYQNTVLSCPTAATHDCLTLSGKNNEVAFNTVRVGVNYLFNAPEPLPLK
ncbi:MAG: outer membrane beta-barrel protein, partial [Rhodomicrobium sp.]